MIPNCLDCNRIFVAPGDVVPDSATHVYYIARRRCSACMKARQRGTRVKPRIATPKTCTLCKSEMYPPRGKAVEGAVPAGLGGFCRPCISKLMAWFSELETTRGEA